MKTAENFSAFYRAADIHCSKTLTEITQYMVFHDLNGLIFSVESSYYDFAKGILMKSLSIQCLRSHDQGGHHK